MERSRTPICAVYILANPSRSIYVGAMQDLERRLLAHKTHLITESNPRWRNVSHALFGWSSSRFKAKSA